MDTVYVRPRLLGDGTPALVRMPERAWAPLPAEGALVPLDEYWARRLRDADVIEAAPPAPEPDSVPADPAPKPVPAAKAAPSLSKEP